MGVELVCELSIDTELNLSEINQVINKLPEGGRESHLFKVIHKDVRDHIVKGIRKVQEQAGRRNSSGETTMDFSNK